MEGRGLGPPYILVMPQDRNAGLTSCDATAVQEYDSINILAVSQNDIHCFYQ